jgi:hypothetical protein
VSVNYLGVTLQIIRVCACVLSVSYFKDNVNMDYVVITLRKMLVVECGLSVYYCKDNVTRQVGIVLELLRR